jgi:CDP-diacylglycerol--glycerol-3-phosphate 3-phosphatidyltransferase
MSILKGIMANILTGCRIILSLIMLHLPVFSPGFYACYLMAGITDMVDGTVARKLGTESEFGERFDTIADFIFVISALYKLLPAVEISMEIWIWTGTIAVIKMVNTMYGFAVQRRLIAIHSWANKMTGLVLFVLPFSFDVIDIRYSAAAVCMLATFAAVQEGHVIRCQKG